MTTDVEAAPVVKWQPGRGLVGADGSLVTDAQLLKARRYVHDGKVERTALTSSESPYGQPSWSRATYRLQPVPGCKAVNEVLVTEHSDATDRLTTREYACRCQFNRTTGQHCAHILAVKLHRGEAL